MYKYTSGNESKFEDAVNLQNNIRKKKKYKDAFVVAFKDGQRISVEDAIELIKK